MMIALAAIGGIFLGMIDLYIAMCFMPPYFTPPW